jgi:hypothetical protein
MYCEQEASDRFPQLMSVSGYATSILRNAAVNDSMAIGRDLFLACRTAVDLHSLLALSSTAATTLHSLLTRLNNDSLSDVQPSFQWWVYPELRGITPAEFEHRIQGAWVADMQDVEHRHVATLTHTELDTDLQKTRSALARCDALIAEVGNACQNSKRRLQDLDILRQSLLH